MKYSSLKSTFTDSYKQRGKKEVKVKLSPYCHADTKGEEV
jgi:hypothetical protein